MSYEQCISSGELVKQIVDPSINGIDKYHPPERLDCHEEIIELERRHYALDYIQKQYNQPNLDSKTRALAPIISPRYGVEEINNQFAHRMLHAFLCKDPNEGLVLFRNLEAHTTDEELALLIHDDDFFTMHEGLKKHLEDSADTITKTVEDRLSPKGQIRWNDRYQFNGIEGKRSLSQIERCGVVVEITPNAHEKIVAACAATKDTQLPMIEFLKNERIVSINGFKDSKVSHIVHDAIDHTWGFQLLQKRGLDKKFTEFFTSIGDPMHTDIFKREGEIISSIGFGVRYGSTQENGFQPIVSCSDLSTIFDKYFVNDRLIDRHMTAYKILRTLAPDSREALSLGFTYSNYIIELNEQRRKHGKIKVRDTSTGKITGELSETDPDFMSLFVELHHEILSSNNKHRNNLFRFHILLEEYLQGIATGSIATDQPFAVRIQDLDKYDYSQTSLPADKLKWMFKHYGFAATKGSLI